MSFKHKVEYTSIPEIKFPEITKRYLAEPEKTRHLFNVLPNASGILDFAHHKNHDPVIRKLLCEVLEKQTNLCKGEFVSTVKNQIDKLKLPDTFTVCTGHQLSLFGGPLMVATKIIQCIKTADHLNSLNPNLNFIPVFWLANEDHDFEEISKFRMFGSEYSWDHEHGGAVGELDCSGVNELIEEVSLKLKNEPFAQEWTSLMKIAYQESSLTNAHRNLLYHLFGSMGLVIIDGSDSSLKASFKTAMIDEVENNVVVNSHVKLNADDFVKGFQAKPHEINLFYLDGAKRELIKKDGDNYILGDESYTVKELNKLVNEHPEKFSPNVLFRPLYQEHILPNVAYIGGPSEVAYWLQLKPVFESFGIKMPAVLMRNTLLPLSERDFEFLSLSHLSIQDLFFNVHEIEKNYALREAGEENSLSKYFSSNDDMFNELENATKNSFPVMISKINATRKKTQNLLNELEKTYIKLIKEKNKVNINKVLKIRYKMIHDNSFSDRDEMLITHHVKYGKHFFNQMINAIEPFNPQITVYNVDKKID